MTARRPKVEPATIELGYRAQLVHLLRIWVNHTQQARHQNADGILAEIYRIGQLYLEDRPDPGIGFSMCGHTGEYHAAGLCCGVPRAARARGKR